MGKKKDIIKHVKYSDLMQMYFSAKGFHNNYDYLKREEAERMGKPQYDDIISVAATNGFLAVELYLKLMYAIIYWEDNEKTTENPKNSTQYPVGHDIRDMFDDLDNRFKDPITNKLLDYLTKEELLKQLDKYKNGFMEWRYIFEKDSLKGDFHFLSKILEAMCSVCKSYIEHYYSLNEEWQQKQSRTSVIMHQEPVASMEEASKYLNMSLKEVLNK